MTTHDPTETNPRRRFFSRVATLVAAAGAAVLARGAQSRADGAEANSTEPAEKRGYRVTEHVRKYYHKARF